MHNCIQDIVHVAQGRTGMQENSDQSITRLEEGSGNPRLLVRDLLADPRLELHLVAGESSVDRSIDGIARFRSRLRPHFRSRRSYCWRTVSGSETPADCSDAPEPICWMI